MRLDRFANRYVNLRLLGRGGFGEVYRAWDPQMERDVAIKVLNPSLADDPDWRKRFRLERLAVSKLDNPPNITIVYDGYDGGGPDDPAYIVMELVKGDTLARIIETRVPLTDVERLGLLEQLCEGLYCAHKQTPPIVHRDIKPVNLMVREESDEGYAIRTLKILDFGIAKVVNTGQTSTGGMMFTPSYVSPEQIEGEAADARSDMFAVGAVAYELLSYHRAFEIVSKNPFTLLEEVKEKIVLQPHRPLLDLRPDLDPELAAVVDRALAKRPDHRFNDLAQLRRSLCAIRARLEESLSEQSRTVVLSPKVQAVVRVARLAIEADDPTSAIASLEGALWDDPTKFERRFLEDTIEEALERQRVKRAERRSREEAGGAEVIRSARSAFISGARTQALEKLAHFQPPELVAEDLAKLRAADAVVNEARRVVVGGSQEERDSALTTLEAFEPVELVATVLEELREIAASRDAADVRRRDEAAAADAIAAARALFLGGSYQNALSLLQGFKDQHRVAPCLRQFERAAAAIDAAFGTVRSAGASGRASAITALAAFEDGELTASAVDELRRIDESRTADEVGETVASARSRFAHGERESAIALLERSASHPAVASAIDELRRADAAICDAADAIGSGDADRRAEVLDRLAQFGSPALVLTALVGLRERSRQLELQEAAERQRILEDQRLAQVRADAESARRSAEATFAAGDTEGAFRILDAFPVCELVADLRARFERDVAAAAATCVEKARELSASGRPKDALAVLRDAAPHRLVADALDELNREVQLRELLQRAHAHLAAGNLAPAASAIREARSLNAAHADVQTLAARILAQQRAQRRLRLRRYGLHVALPLVLVIAVGSAGYRLWLDGKTARPPIVGTNSGSESPRPDPAVSEIAELVKQGRLAEAVNRLEVALKKSPEDDALNTSRDLIALDAKKSANTARQRAAQAGVTSDSQFGEGAAADSQAQAHAATGRVIDSIRSYWTAMNHFDAALKSAGPLAQIDGFLKTGERGRALDVLTSALAERSDDARLIDRLQSMKREAVAAADRANTTVQRSRNFDAAAQDYRAAADRHKAALSNPKPEAGIRGLWASAEAYKAAGENMQTASAFRARGNDLARAGKRADALAQLKNARTQFPAYTAADALARDLVKIASTEMSAAKQAATQAGGGKLKVFSDALQKESVAARAGTTEPAIQGYWEAADLYRTAEREAPEPPPVSPPGATNPPPATSSDPPATSTRSERDATESPVTPTPQANTFATDRVLVRAVLDQYKTGYLTFSENTILSVYPTFSVERRRALRESKSACNGSGFEFIGEPDVTIVSESAAFVTVKAIYGCKTKPGARNPVMNEIIKLQKTGGRWIITDMSGT